jgi:uncharacterized protein with ATP-grasp and redox domains
MEIAITNMHDTVDERCKSCFFNTYQRLFEKFNVGIAQRKKFISFFQETIIKHKNLSTPEIQRELNKEFCRIINVNDPFEEEKANSNHIALELYKEWKPKVLSSVNPFDLALRLSIAGNIMDYGANNSFDVHETINKVLKTSFAIDHSELLKNKIKKAKRILYLGDNAGEIVFDKLFLETIMHNHVIYAVKDAPVLNDVTMTDAKEIGMDLVADVISNGFDAPSTVLNKCSEEFIGIYKSADLIISKGQGNYEGLMKENDPRIFFLLMAKCDVIAEILHVKKGSFVVAHQTEKTYRQSKW